MDTFKGLREPQGSAFRRYVVLEVINSTTIPRDKVKELYPTIENKEHFGQTTGEDIESQEVYLIAPRNSVVGTLVADGQGKIENSSSIMYPFFSSHLSLPVKPGEYVWGFEEEDGKVFWVTRIHEPDHIEDLNYTHGDRRKLPTKIGVNELPDSKIEISLTPSFPNGQTLNNRNTDLEDFETVTVEALDDKDIEINKFTLPKIDSYEKIIEENVAIDQIVYEPVPRLTKRPGDLSLQGSNNTSITLGTERGFGTAVRPTPDSETSNVSPDSDDASFVGLAEGMGAIDIVVGRGRTYQDFEALQEENPEATQPRLIENSRGNYETHKAIGLDTEKGKEGSAFTDPQEGDPDMVLDASRFYMTMKSNPDALFNLSYPDTAAGTAVDETPDNAAIIAKSDQIRIIARKDDANNINGSVRIIKEGTEDSDRATIVMQPDGTIMIDGPKIVIGSGIEGANGEGSQVFIGRDATESVVLGDTLLEMLDEFLLAIGDEAAPLYLGNLGGPLSTPVPTAASNLRVRLTEFLSKNAKTK